MKLKILLFLIFMGAFQAPAFSMVALRRKTAEELLKISRQKMLNKVPRREIAAETVIITSATANPLVAPIVLGSCGTLIGCKIAFELIQNGHSATYDDIKDFGIGFADWVASCSQCIRNNNPDIDEDQIYSEKLTNKEARQKAKEWGYTEGKPDFDTHGELAFKKGNRWISVDKDAHNGGVWKEYKGKKRIGTLDKDGNKIGD